MKNPCGKLTTPELAYEVWGSPNSRIVYFVLKKYQLPEQEANNPYARWYVAARNADLGDSFEYGDMYVDRVKANMRLIDNPLCYPLYLRIAESDLPSPLQKYRHISLGGYNNQLTGYTYLPVPKKDLERVGRILQKHDIHVVCHDEPNPIEKCFKDLQRRQK